LFEHLSSKKYHYDAINSIENKLSQEQRQKLKKDFITQRVKNEKYDLVCSYCKKKYSYEEFSNFYSEKYLLDRDLNRGFNKNCPHCYGFIDEKASLYRNSFFFSMGDCVRV
jgi:hypothetical protein